MVHKVTQREIAKRANVSPSTVSRVLGHDDFTVSAELRRAVEDAMRELQYTEKKKAAPQKNAARRTRIGVLLGNIQHDAMGSMLSGILSVADSYNIEIILQSYDNDPQKELRLLSALQADGVDALIAIPADPIKLNPIYEDMLRSSFPVIFLLSEASLLERPDASVVTKDSSKGAASAYKYLLDLGHRNILLLGAPGRNDRYKSRVRACEEVCALEQITFPSHLITPCEDDFSAAVQTIKQCLQTQIFTAIFAMTDTLAFGAWQALKDMNLRVPADVSIVGYDDLKAAFYMGLTTVSEPLCALGSSAVYMAMEQLNGNATGSRRAVLLDSLIIRNSCKGLAR